MDFSVLGSLKVDDECGPIVLRAPKQRVLLAVLVCFANERVSLDRLSYALWGDRPPPAAADNVRQYVFHLRRALRDPGRIERRSAGYALVVHPGELDVARFEALAAGGRQALAAGDPAGAAKHLREALQLWRGDAFADLLDVGLLRDEAVRLDERRMAVTEARIDADLRLGRHTEIAAELAQLVRAHPLRERTRAQLMLALYQSGRQAEALAVYRDAKRALATEVGLDPGPELRRLEQAILVADPELDLSATVPTPPPRVPALLPADVAGFVGRTSELDRLDQLWDRAAAPEALVINAIGGTAGVGKTALALRWAHRARDSFPDGQLYVNLRGYDPEQPLSTAQALAGFLDALGVRGQDIPLGLDDRAAKYRSELAGRRVLVLLDNAASVEQIRPLLPGTPGCLVVVTSRDSLAGLVALHGASRVDLDVLTPQEAVALLRRLVGARVDAEPAAATALATQCARLPLAMRVAAEIAVARPATRLAELVEELADHQQRLQLLDAGGDPRAAVSSVFSWSYRHLPDDAARAFRCLGLHPGTDLDHHAGAALIGADAGTAQRLLIRLARASLIQSTGTGRWGMHDLMRGYAGQLAATHDSMADRQAATGRLLDHYLDAAGTASAALSRPGRPGTVPIQPAVDPAAARSWLDAERSNLASICSSRAADGWHTHIISLAQTLTHYLDAGGHLADALVIHGRARAAAHHVGDRVAQARAAANLGRVYRRHGQLELAADTYQRSVALYVETTDVAGQAYALWNLGTICSRQGRYEQAANRYQRALTLFRQIDDRNGEADGLSSLGLLYERLGRLTLASEHLKTALARYRQIDNTSSAAFVLSTLGRLQQREDQAAQAAVQLERSLVHSRQSGNRTAEAYALTDLANVFVQQNRLVEATDHLRQALHVFRRIGDKPSEAEVLNGLGEILLERGAVAPAREHHRQALDAAEEIGDRYEHARAHDGIAAAHRAADNLDQAREHWRLALDRYVELAVPDAEAVREHLAKLDQPSTERAVVGLLRQRRAAL